MKLLDHRSEIINQHFVRGKKHTVSSNTSELLLPSASGAGLRYLEIKGKTEQKQYKGANLFDISQVSTSSSYYIDKTDTSITVGNCKSTWQGIWCPIPRELVQGKTVYIRAHYEKSASTVNAGVFLRWKDDSGSTTVGIVGSTVAGMSGEINASGIFAIPEERKDAEVYLVIYANTGNSERTGEETITYSNILLSLEDTAYEPYTGMALSPSPSYPQKIENTIANISCNNEAISTDIMLCGIGEYKDCLEVDYVNKRAIRRSQIELYTFTGNEPIEIWEEGTKHTAVVDMQRDCTEYLGAYCTHFVECQGLTDEDIADEAPYFEIADRFAHFRNIDATTPEEFARWLRDNNVQIAYIVEATEEIIDNKELFDITTPYGTDATISIPMAGDIKATYYSTEYEDTISLTINYVNENGVAIKESDTHIVRKDGECLLIVPFIEGYVPINLGNEGYFTEDCEVTIIYSNQL